MNVYSTALYLSVQASTALYTYIRYCTALFPEFHDTNTDTDLYFAKYLCERALTPTSTIAIERLGQLNACMTRTVRVPKDGLFWNRHISTVANSVC